MKFNGKNDVPIEASQIKQIAGRAGRYRTAAQAAQGQHPTESNESSSREDKSQRAPVSSAQNLGLVTTFHRQHLPMVQRAMEDQAEPIMSAGILPPTDVLVRFAAYFPPSTPLSYILLRLHEVSLLHPRFHLCVLKDHIKIADTIEPVEKLTINDRILFCASPASMTDEAMIPVVCAFAECVGNGTGGGIMDLSVLNLRLLENRMVVANKDYLGKLEFLHKCLILYLWLSYRFAGVFNTQAMAFYVKKIVEERIQEALAQVPMNKKDMHKHWRPTAETTKSGVQESTPLDGLVDDEKPLRQEDSLSTEEGTPGPTDFAQADEEDAPRRISGNLEADIHSDILDILPPQESLGKEAMP